jgi:hypothetical protein
MLNIQMNIPFNPCPKFHEFHVPNTLWMAKAPWVARRMPMSSFPEARGSDGAFWEAKCREKMGIVEWDDGW